MQEKVGACVAVILKNEDNKVLIGRRPDKMQNQTEIEEQGTWTLPMTEIRQGEEFEQAAARVAMQEAGIRVDFSRVACVNNDKTDKAQFATVGMVSDRWIGEAQVKNPEKIVEWSWFSLEDSPFPIYIPSAKALMCFKKGKFNFST
ncbi:MAG TPA: NUDIX domain-containing protein [Candidatus Nanoarchaeia archaeon]|nr:NUDIX domain-containing protein [Candidatus Nanoarchaeia archaeon]